MGEQQSGDGALVAGLLLGALVGAVIGVWKAPHSGAELRNRLLHRGSAAVSSAERAVAGERTADALAEGKALARQRQAELLRTP